MPGKIRGAVLAPFWLAVGVFVLAIIAVMTFFDWLFKTPAPPDQTDD